MDENPRGENPVKRGKEKERLEGAYSTEAKDVGTKIPTSHHPVHVTTP